MISARKLSTWLLGCCLTVQAIAAMPGTSYPLASGSGVIESLSFADATMVVSGYRYRVAVDVKVEIGGSYGAFTMLKPGMPIRYEFLRISPTERRMVLIEELPPNVDPGVM